MKENLKKRCETFFSACVNFPAILFTFTVIMLNIGNFPHRKIRLQYEKSEKRIGYHIAIKTLRTDQKIPDVFESNTPGIFNDSSRFSVVYFFIDS
ncbi:hypothetical protein LB467_10475 [Salegentibacter sp. JZCK2]|uniref:hypothetical protein n=1 Tax=Salegentibacter tibetensis TaxID=2873600 RepID=UPI001CCE7F91|nr:hypothetical protein [Salegentibacter tibetensis]MBZ9730111.1 hypothetical protein [Salegentibacter tibetensis]